MSLKEVLDGYVELGYIDRKEKDNLYLYNYSAECQFKGMWNYYTEWSRGLIIDKDSNIIARPIKKFFNLNERPEVAPDKLPNEIPEVSIKMDGSLVNMFWHKATFHFATRGSFDSEQAQKAVQIFKDKYDLKNFINILQDWTLCFEIIYPENRIVIDYGDTCDLFLITAVNKEGGYDLSYRDTENLAKELGVKTIYSELRPLTDVREEIDKGGVTNKEGYVLRFLSNGLRVKIKFEEYKRIHRIITGSSVKSIWECMRGKQDMTQWLLNLPQEYLTWFDAERNKLQSQFDQVHQKCKTIFQSKPNGTRKDIAIYFQNQTKNDKRLQSVLFRMLNGEDYQDQIWKLIEPESQIKDFRKFNQI